MTRPVRPPPAYLSTPHPCGYFLDRTAVSLVLDRDEVIDAAQYELLLENGFRRSGDLFYRPHCPRCHECVPARIPLADFRPRRNQRRVCRRNRELEVVRRPAGFRQSHYELYLRYQQARHPGGTMGAMTPEEYLGFVTRPGLPTEFFEYRLTDHLVGVAVVDILPRSFSSVYTFFDPADAGRSPGTFAILDTIDQAKRRNCDFVYLGYWIRHCRKMSYKVDFRPVETFSPTGKWQPRSDDS